MPTSSKTIKDVLIEIERAEGKLVMYNELLSVCKDIEEDKLEVFSEVFPKHKQSLVEEVTKELNDSRQKIIDHINKLNDIEVKVGTSTAKQRTRKPRAKKVSKSSK